MEILIGLALVLILVDVSMAEKKIRCFSECYEVKEAVLLNDGSYLTCRIKVTGGVPKTARNDKTAETPESLSGNWFVHENRRIALDLSWVHRETYTRSPNFKGFYLAVERKETCTHYKAIIRFHKTPGDLVVVVNNATDKDPFITFSYKCHGTNGDVIRPNESRSLSLNSIPLAKREDNYHVKRATVTTPDCMQERGRELLKIQNEDIVPNLDTCKRFWKRVIEESKMKSETTTAVITTKAILRAAYVKDSEDPDSDRNEKWQIGVLVTLGLILMATFIVAIAILIKNKTSTTHCDLPHETTLMIADTTDTEVLRKSHKLSTYLQDHFNIEIITNWENREKMAKMTAACWYASIKPNTIIFIEIDDKFEIDKFIGAGNNHKQDELPKENETVKKYLLKKWKNLDKDIIILVKNQPKLLEVPKTVHNFKLYTFKERYSDKDEFYKYVKKKSCTHHTRLDNRADIAESEEFQNFTEDNNRSDQGDRRTTTTDQQGTRYNKGGARPKQQPTNDSCTTIV